MKNSAILAAAALAAFVTGCAGTSIRHLPGDEWVTQAQRIETFNSASWATYVGATTQRAYLEYGDVLVLFGKSRTIVYWTELDALPPLLAARLRANDPPWVPWAKRLDFRHFDSPEEKTLLP